MTRNRDSALHRASTQLGEAFENWVDLQHALAGVRGALVHVTHNQAQSRVVRGRLIYSAAGVADYTGMLYGGIYLASEAKSTGKERLPKSEITPDQQDHLNAVTAGGGKAFLLVEFRGVTTLNGTLLTEPRRYAVPWRDVPWKMLRTAESVGELDLVNWRALGHDYLQSYHPGSPNHFFVGAAAKQKRIHPRE